MQKLVTIVGPVQKLDKAIEAPTVYHPDVRLVKHPIQTHLFWLPYRPWPPRQDVRNGSLGRIFTFKNPQLEKYMISTLLGSSTQDPGDSSVLWTVWAGEQPVEGGLLLHHDALSNAFAIGTFFALEFA